MATFNFASVADQFPVGTVVGAYLARHRNTGGAPFGSAVETATVASTGALAFDELIHDTEYVAYALVGGVHKYRGFGTHRPRTKNIQIIDPGDPLTPENAAKLISTDTESRVIKEDATAEEVLAAFEDQAAGLRIVSELDEITLDPEHLPLTVASGVIVDFHRTKVTTTGDRVKLFDLLSDTQHATILLREAEHTGERFDPDDDGLVRGERKSCSCTAVYCGGEYNYINIGKVDGYYTGVTAYPLASGNTTLKAEGTRNKGNTVIIGESGDNTDFPMVYAGQDGLHREIRGRYGAHPESPHPPHLIYATPNRTSIGGTGHGNAWDGIPCTEGINGGAQDDVAHAFQLKGDLSGTYDSHRARNCHGGLNLADGSSISMTQCILDDCLGSPGGQITFQGDGVVHGQEGECTIGYVRVTFAEGEDNGRAIRLDGQQNYITRADVYCNLDDTSSDHWVTDQGDDCGIGKLNVTNSGSGGRRGLLTRSTSTDSQIGVGRMSGVTYGMHVEAGAVRAGLEYDGRLIEATSRTVLIAEPTTHVSRPPARAEVTHSAAGTVVVDPGRYDEYDITVASTGALAVSNPATTDMVEGQQFTVTMTNSTGGTMATPTWGALFAVYSFTKPANGLTSTITFRWDGTALVQTVGRGVAAFRSAAGVLAVLKPDGASSASNDALLGFNDDRGAVGYSGTAIAGGANVLGDAANAKPTMLYGLYSKIAGGLEYRTRSLSGNWTATEEDFLLRFNTDAARALECFTVAAKAGRSLIVADVTGGAASNNITVTPNASDQFILNGALVSSFTIARAYGCAWLLNITAARWLVIPLTPITAVQTYAATNVTTDRAFDADTVAVAELADVVGTLIADLRTVGIVA